MTDDLHKRAEDVQERIREWWEYDTGHLMSASSDVIAALLARLEAVEKERDDLSDLLNKANEQAGKNFARAEKAEVVLAEALAASVVALLVEFVTVPAAALAAKERGE